MSVFKAVNSVASPFVAISLASDVLSLVVKGALMYSYTQEGTVVLNMTIAEMGKERSMKEDRGLCCSTLKDQKATSKRRHTAPFIAHDDL